MRLPIPTTTLRATTAMRRRALHVVLCVVCWLSLFGHDASLAASKRYAIPAGNLSDALIAYALQSDRQVLYAPATVAGVTVPGVEGEHSIEAALELLLADTGIAARRINDRTFYLERAPSSIGSAATTQPPLAISTEAAYAASMTELGAMTVTGSRVRGIELPGATLIRIDGASLRNDARPDVTDVLRLLPQVLNFGADEALVGGASVQNSTLNTTYARSINLRGLGASSTLVLVNGRRIAPSGSGAQLTDVSSIPIAAIERIEVHTEGASAVYGSDAVGGVVNLILKRKTDDVISTARYGWGDDIDGLQLSQVFGHLWDSGALTLTYEYESRDRLLASDRPRLYDDDFTRFGGADNRPLHSSPSNIVFDSASVPAEAQATYAIPRLTSNAPLSLSQLAAGEEPNRQSLWHGRTVLPEQRHHSFVISAEQQVSPAAKLYFDGFYTRREFEQAQPNVAGTFATISVPASNPYSPCNPANDAANALGIACVGDPVSVTYSSIRDLGPSVRSGRHSALHASTGLQIEIGAWLSDLSLTFSTSETQRASSNFANNAALAMALGNSVDATGAIVDAGTPGAYVRPASVPTLNPFCSGCIEPETAAFIRAGQYLGSEYDQTTALVSFNGPLAYVRSGAIMAAVGLEFRSDEFASFNALGTGVVYDTPTGSRLRRTESANERDVSAAFVELHVPLIGAHNARPGLRLLDASISARREAYDDLGSVSNPRMSLRWQPFEGLSLSATYGRSFRAPSLSDSDPSSTAQIGAGPPAGGAYTAAQLGIEQGNPDRPLFVIGRAGGNADLVPETASSWSAGVTWRPPNVPSLQVGLNYYSIEYNHRIDAPGANAGPIAAITNADGYFDEFLTYNPAYFPERAPGNGIVDGFDARAAEGFLGLVQHLYASEDPPFAGAAPDATSVAAVLDGRRSNAARLTTRGLDASLQASLETRYGTWRAMLVGNLVFEWKTAPSPNVPFVDAVDRIFNPVSKQATLQLGWQRDAWSAAFTSRYTGAYRNDTQLTFGRYARVDDWLVHDVLLAYDTGERWSGPGSNVRIALGVQNVLDEEPPLALNTNILFDPQYANALGRYSTLSVTKRW